MLPRCFNTTVVYHGKYTYRSHRANPRKPRPYYVPSRPSGTKQRPLAGTTSSQLKIIINIEILFTPECQLTGSLENLGDGILLIRKRLLIDLVQQTSTPSPAHDGIEEGRSPFFRAEPTQLNNDEGTIATRAGGEDRVSVEFFWSSFDAVPEVFEQGGSGGTLEFAKG